MTTPTLDSFLRNCIIQSRDDDDEPIFEMYTDADGAFVVRARLDGYAIIPIEVYEGLSPKAPPTIPPTLPSST